LQNTIHWIKAITLPGEDGGEISRGHFKPISSPRFLNDCTNTFSISRSREKRPLDRLALGVPYADKSNIARWRHTRGRDRRCRGNTWFVPYETIQRREKERPHSGDLPGATGGQLHPTAWPNENEANARSLSRNWKFRGGRAAPWPNDFCRIRDRSDLFRGSEAAGRSSCGVARASRVLVAASRCDELSDRASLRSNHDFRSRVRERGTHSPGTRDACATRSPLMTCSGTFSVARPDCPARDALAQKFSGRAVLRRDSRPESSPGGRRDCRCNEERTPRVFLDKPASHTAARHDGRR